MIMKGNLLQGVLGMALAMMTGQAMAQDVQEVVSVKSDVTLTTDAKDAAKPTEKAIEMYTSRTDGTITREYLGLMSFQVPVKTGYAIKSANLKLVTERAKGTLAIYALGANVSDADTYNSQIDNVNAARETEPIAKIRLRGTDGQAVTDAKASSNVEDWINNIDITDYVKSVGGNVNLVLLNAAESTTTSIKVYTSDATDVTNTKVNPNFTFAAADLKPQLTVVYEVDTDQKTDVSTTTADTWIRKDAANNNYGSKATLELKSKDNTDFVGLMSFKFPAEALDANHEVTRATLRLVTERVKSTRTLNIYKYVDFEENTTYGKETDNVAAAKTAENLVATCNLKGQNVSFTYDKVGDDYKTVDAWTNEIDLTSFVKGLDTNTFSLLLEHANATDQLMIYTKETEDVTNAKDASLVFKKEDLVPLLTVVYTKKNSTGVETIEVNVPATADNNVYSLQGVRMNGKSLPAGIYIKNDKKFVVK